MATPNLVLKETPNVIDGQFTLRVPFEDQANPLIDENGIPKNQYPEFIEYIPIPSDATLDTAFVEASVTTAYAQALIRAENWAAAMDVKAVLLPVIADYSAGGLESKMADLKVVLEKDTLKEVI